MCFAVQGCLELLIYPQFQYFIVGNGAIAVYPIYLSFLGAGANCKKHDKLIYFIVRVRGQLRRVGVVIGVEMEACAALELRVC
jgi:hypothetical protein